MAQVTFLTFFFNFCMAEVTLKTSPLTPQFDNSFDYNKPTVTQNISIEGLHVNNLSYFEESCQAKFVSYAYQKGICGANNVLDFLEINKAQYTCARRCGQKATFGKRNECSCDAACIVFGDCCEDFEVTCTELYNKGSNLSSHLKGAMVACSSENFGELYLDGPNDLLTTDSYFTGLSTTYPLQFSTDGDSSFAFFKHVMYISASLEEYKVIDSTSGVIFKNYASFNKWRLPGPHNPTFLPVIRFFECYDTFVKFPEPSKLFNLLSNCFKSWMHHAKTSLYRNCLSYPVVSCTCEVSVGETTQFLDLHRNTCTGGRGDVPLFTRHLALFEHLKSRGLQQSMTENLSDDECFSWNYEMSNVDYADSYHNPKTTFKIITIANTLQTWRHVAEATEDGNSSDSIDGILQENGKVDVDNQWLDSNAVEFVVELTKAIERRIRCPKLQSPLYKCKLEECVNGALVWPNPPFDTMWKFLNGVCFLPTKVVVDVGPARILGVPACTCMRIMLALSDLRQWNIVMTRSNQSSCVFKLNTHRVDIPDFEDRFYDGAPIKYNYTVTTKEIEAALQKHLYMTQEQCLDVEVRGLRLCFFDHKEKNSRDCQVSMTLFAGLTGHENNIAKSQRISYLSTISVVLGFFANVIFFLG